MDDLFQIDGQKFIDALMHSTIQKSDNIDLSDIFDIYVKLASESCNAVTQDRLKVLIFKQFQNYGDYDKQVRETAQTVSNITKSTSQVITAIETENKDGLTKAYNELKDYSDTMIKIEKSQYIDEKMDLHNRKYLFTQLLSSDLNFQEDGTLFYLKIDDLDSLQNDYGTTIANTIIKKFSQVVKKMIEACASELIMYESNRFVILAESNHILEVQKALNKLHHTLSTKKFKISGDKAAAFNFSMSEMPYNKGESFEKTYEEVLTT